MNGIEGDEEAAGRFLYVFMFEGPFDRVPVPVPECGIDPPHQFVSACGHIAQFSALVLHLKSPRLQQTRAPGKIFASRPVYPVHFLIHEQPHVMKLSNIIHQMFMEKS